MPETDPNPGREYSLERTEYGDAWRVDDEGYLHLGGGSSHIEGITITYQETRNE